MPTSTNRLAACLVAVTAAIAVASPSVSRAQALAGSLERVRVHGPALEGNLTGDDATRDVFVYLPPSYSRDTD